MNGTRTPAVQVFINNASPLRHRSRQVFVKQVKKLETTTGFFFLLQLWLNEVHGEGGDAGGSRWPGQVSRRSGHVQVSVLQWTIALCLMLVQSRHQMHEGGGQLVASWSSAGSRIVALQDVDKLFGAVMHHLVIVASQTADLKHVAALFAGGKHLVAESGLPGWAVVHQGRVG